MRNARLEGQRCRFRAFNCVSSRRVVAIRNIGARRHATTVRVHRVRDEKRFGVGAADIQNLLRVARSTSKTVSSASSSRTMVLKKHGWEAMGAVVHANGSTFSLSESILLTYADKGLCLFTPLLFPALSSTFPNASSMSIRPRTRRFLRMWSVSHRSFIRRTYNEQQTCVRFTPPTSHVMHISPPHLCLPLL